MATAADLSRCLFSNRGGHLAVGVPGIVAARVAVDQGRGRRKTIFLRNVLGSATRAIRRLDDVLGDSARFLARPREAHSLPRNPCLYGLPGGQRRTTKDKEDRSG